MLHVSRTSLTTPIDRAQRSRFLSQTNNDYTKRDRCIDNRRSEFPSGQSPTYSLQKTLVVITYALPMYTRPDILTTEHVGNGSRSQRSLDPRREKHQHRPAVTKMCTCSLLFSKVSSCTVTSAECRWPVNVRLALKTVPKTSRPSVSAGIDYTTKREQTTLSTERCDRVRLHPIEMHPSFRIPTRAKSHLAELGRCTISSIAYANIRVGYGTPRVTWRRRASYVVCTAKS